MIKHRVSEYFTREEFACRCGCGFAAADIELVQLLEEIRLDLGRKPIIIHSGCRCCYWNGVVSGAKNSMHLFGMAADFHISGVSIAEVYEYLDSKHPYAYGIGRYGTWVHLDVRLDPARW